MQQGDCNVPVIFQHLMTWIFHDHIRLSVQVYLDNVFIFSDTIDKHKGHLSLVFKVLCKHHLFLSRNKLDLYSKDMDCLGHHVDDQGLHADSDKMSSILEWRVFRSFSEVLQFLRLVKYLAHFMLDVHPHWRQCATMV